MLLFEEDNHKFRENRNKQPIHKRLWTVPSFFVHSSMALQLFVGPWLLPQFRKAIFQTVKD
jgi:hypothetical protein